VLFVLDANFYCEVLILNAALTVYIGRKIAHFLREFSAYSPEMQEFDMESDSRDVIIRNPACPDSDEDAIYIEFGEEFTVYWHTHRHFSPEDYWYDMLVEFVHDILDSRFVAAGFFDGNDKWLGFAHLDSPVLPENPKDAIALLAPSEEDVQFCRERGIPYKSREDWLRHLDEECYCKLWTWNAPMKTIQLS